MTKRRILITGATGMLGRTLAQHWSGRHEVFTPKRSELDITDALNCATVIRDVRPEIVVHCAAHTAVDRCEAEAEAAYRLNAIGSANIAIACQRAGARLIAISTDYVFSGDASRPYHEWDEPAPRTVYGATKLAGEVAVRTHCADHIIARVAWLYGPGGPSFVHTMLRLGSQAGDPLRVVNDQIGNPTSTIAVAAGLDQLIDGAIVGTVHLTCSGETSWYGFTQEIMRLRGFERVVIPCTTDAYPRPAPRPSNSRLDKMALRLHGFPEMPIWQDALAFFLRAHPNG
jgi:dTDP-4-dehydrorhamnose reductase